VFFKKDKLSQFNFISTVDFVLALILMFIATVFSFVLFPFSLKKALGQYSNLIDSNCFGIFVFFLSSFLTLYIIYYFCCKKRQKSLKEGLFLYIGSNKVFFISFLIGIIMPLVTLPIIFKFAPKEFYAMDLLRKQGGLVYLFTCALTAPIFEEIFYRGFIFPFFQSKLNSFWAVIITSVVFGFSHFMNIGNAQILLSLFIFYGFVLSLIRYFTNSLIPPVITHFVHNVTLIVSFLLASRI